MSEDMREKIGSLAAGLSTSSEVVAFAALETLSGHDVPVVGPFARLLGMQFDVVENGRCVASLEVKAHLLNPLGIAHGAVPYALADSASGGAAISAVGAPKVVTQDMLYRYHGAARPGVIRAEAEVIYHGSRTLTTQARVFQGEVLIGSATGTFAILGGRELASLK